MAWSHELSRAVMHAHTRVTQLEDHGLAADLIMLPEKLNPAEAETPGTITVILGVPVLFTHMVSETYICVRAER